MLRLKPRTDRFPANTHLIIDRDLCYSCGACVAVCPPDALFLHDMTLQVDDASCTLCDRCVSICPVHALSLQEAQPIPA